MYHRRLLSGVLAWLLLAVPFSHAADPTALAEVRYLPDQVYRSVAGQELMLDLAYPRASKGPFPTVVLIHGTGLFTAGRKGQVALALDLARAGYVAAAVSYRYSPTDPFPDAIDDLRCAVRWLRTKANKYPVQAERFAAVGFSGGGTLACLLGMAPPPKGEAKTGPSSKVQAVVSYFGPTDLIRLHAAALRLLQRASWQEKLRGLYLKSALETWLGGPPAVCADRYFSASPITYAAKTSAPLLLIHGTADGIVPVAQSKLLARKLTNVGGQVRLLLMQGAPHDFDDLGGPESQRAAEAVRSFLAQQLKSR
jgi:acetyl esterase/lipase